MAGTHSSGPEFPKKSFGFQTQSNKLFTPESERVFQCTNRKPIETTTSFPNSHLGSENNLNLFLKKDETKLRVLSNFRTLNRDLTQAYLRQFHKRNLKGFSSTIPAKIKNEAQYSDLTKDQETMEKVSSIFKKM